MSVEDVVMKLIITSKSKLIIINNSDYIQAL